MTFDELRDLISDIRLDERRMSVRFGCDCGCGGDFYSEEDWDEMCYASYLAIIKLKALGITFTKEI